MKMEKGVKADPQTRNEAGEPKVGVTTRATSDPGVKDGPKADKSLPGASVQADGTSDPGTSDTGKNDSKSLP